MILNQTIILSRDDLFQLVRKALMEKGYDVCNMSEAVNGDYVLTHVSVELASKDMKI